MRRMDKKQVNEIKEMLWEYLRYLNRKYEEYSTDAPLSRWCGLNDEALFCKEEIEFWKEYG